MKLVCLLPLCAVFIFSDVTAAKECDVQTKQCHGYTSTTSHFVCNVCPKYSGNCVWWAAYKRRDLAAQISGSGWNGGQWYDQFKNLGFPVGAKPSIGAIVEFSKPGHVAYVEKHYPDGSFDVSEMDALDSIGFDPGLNHATYTRNSNGTYNRNGGSTSWTLKGFIYKTSCNPTQERCDIRVSGSVGWFPPVLACSDASQWFIIGTMNGERMPIGTSNVANCPRACAAPN